MGMVTSTHFPPPVMIDSTELRKWVTHILCWSWAMYFSAAASSENDQGQHEFGLEDGFRALHDPVQGGCHPGYRGMPDVALHVAHLPSGIALIPRSVELLRGIPQLHDEIAGQVLRLGLAPFLPPKPE